MSELQARSIVEAGEMLAAGDASAIGLLEATLDRLAATEPRVHAYTEVFETRAREEARSRDAERAAGAPTGPLHGIPVAVKDAIAVEGAVMRAGSAGLPDRPAPADADSVAALRGAGAVIVGLTDLPELALGLASPETRNAWDPGRHPGGSSSGSAAAVAVGSAFAALGTDSGGSIRIPAAANGVVGLKPTRGSLSNAGVMPLAASLDVVGPIARSVEDCRIVFECLAGLEAGTAAPSPAPAGPFGERVGLDERLLEGDVDADIAAAVRAALEGLEAAGIEVVPIRMVALGGAVDAAITLIQAEMAPRFRDLPDGRPEAYHPAVGEFLEAGALLPDAEVDRARATEERVTAELADLFADQRLAAVALPTFPRPPSRLDRAGRVDPDSGSRRFVGGAIEYTTFANLAGLPALTVPCGFTGEILPVGLQLVAPPRREDVLFRLGAAVPAPISMAVNR